MHFLGFRESGPPWRQWSPVVPLVPGAIQRNSMQLNLNGHGWGCPALGCDGQQREDSYEEGGTISRANASVGTLPA